VHAFEGIHQKMKLLLLILLSPAASYAKVPTSMDVVAVETGVQKCVPVLKDAVTELEARALRIRELELQVEEMAIKLERAEREKRRSRED